MADCRVGGASSTGWAGVPRVGDGGSRVGTSGGRGEGEGGVEGCGEVRCPGPPVRDLDLPFALTVNDAGGGVQQPVAQRLGFGISQGRVQAQELEPAQEVGGDHGRDAPGGVDAHRGRGQMVQTGGLAAADPVFDAGVGAVTGFEEVQLAAGGVGGGELVAPSVGLLQCAQLRAGRRAFAAAEDPHRGVETLTGRGSGHQRGRTSAEQTHSSLLMTSSVSAT